MKINQFVNLWEFTSAWIIRYIEKCDGKGNNTGILRYSFRMTALASYTLAKIHEQGEESQFAFPFAKVSYGPDRPFQRIAGRYKPPSCTINKIRNDTLGSACSIMFPLCPARARAWSKKEEYKNTTSSNVVLFPSFALYYSSISSRTCVSSLASLYTFFTLSRHVYLLILSVPSLSLSLLLYLWSPVPQSKTRNVC